MKCRIPHYLDNQARNHTTQAAVSAALAIAAATGGYTTPMINTTTSSPR